MADVTTASATGAGATTTGTHNSTTVQGQAATSVTPQASTGVKVTPSDAIAPAGASAGDWLAGLADDAKGYVANKGFKAPADLLDSYRNLEKLQGVPQDRLLKLPEDMSSPEARAVWERLGAPKTAAEYELAKLLPKENADPKMAETFANTFHELGVPKQAAEKIVSKWNEYLAQGLESQKAAQTMAAKEADAKLRGEWGAAYEQNKNIVDAAARNVGMGAKEVEALRVSLGNEAAAKLLFKIGTATGEASFVSGAGGGAANGVLSPVQAGAKIAELKSDASFTARYLAGDVAARKEMQRYMEMAYPGEVSI